MDVSTAPEQESHRRTTAAVEDSDGTETHARTTAGDQIPL
jgi:hypothetical protein